MAPDQAPSGGGWGVSGSAPWSISRLGAGCAALGNLYAPISDADAQATLEAAVVGGANYFDTAPYYGHGLSEQRLGQFLSKQHRSDLRVSTKVGRGLRPVGQASPEYGFVDALPNEPFFDYGRDGVEAQLAASRQRLHREFLDIVLVHDLGRMTHGEAHAATLEEALAGAFPLLAAQRSAGRLGAIGVGVNEVEVCEALLDRVDLDVILIAGRYTLLDTSAAGLLDRCAGSGVGVIIGGPYNSGILAGGDRFDYERASPALSERVKRLAATCRQHGVALPAAALHFCLAHPAVISVVPGPRSPAEAQANGAHLAEAIPSGLWRDLKDAGLIPSTTATP